MAKQWSEVVASEEFQVLSSLDKERARHAYFDEVVKPQLQPGQLGDAWNEFDLDSKQTIASFGGLDVTNLPHESRTVKETTGDALKSAAAGANTMAQGMTWLSKQGIELRNKAAGAVLGEDNPWVEHGEGEVDAANRLQGEFGEGAEYWQGKLSETAKAQHAELEQAEGVMDTLGTLRKNPALISDILAGSAPYFLPSVGATRLVALGGAGGKALTATAVGTGAAIEGADSAVSVEERIANLTEEELNHSRAYLSLIAEGASHDEAVQQLANAGANKAFLVSSAISVLASLATGAAKLEVDLASNDGLRDSLLKSITRQGTEEAAQEGGNAFGQNVGVKPADESVGLGDGVAKSATLGGVVGVGQASGASSITALADNQQPVQATPEADAAYEQELHQFGEDLKDGYVENAPALEGPQAPADFYADTEGNVSNEQPTDASAEAVRTENGDLINPQTGEIIESAANQEAPAPNEHDSFEAVDDADIQELASVQDYAELAGMVGVDSEGIEAALRLGEEASIIDTLESMIADKQKSQPDPFDLKKNANYGERNNASTDGRPNTNHNGAREEPTQTPGTQPANGQSEAGYGARLDSSPQPNNPTPQKQAGFGAVELEPSVAVAEPETQLLNQGNVEPEVKPEKPISSNPTEQPVTPAPNLNSEPAIEASKADQIAEPSIKTPEPEAVPNVINGAKAKEQPESDIDVAANEAATSPTNTVPEPTDAQIEAGNYKKGHVQFQGLAVAIENPKGSQRSGTDPDGNSWSVEMQSHYGYLKRTTGADNEQVDVFVGPNDSAANAYIVDQVNPDGSFDEHKVMLGFDSQSDATEAYAKNYTADWKVGPVTQMPIAELKTWVKEGDTKKPVSDTLKAPIEEKPKTRAEQLREKLKQRSQDKAKATGQPLPKEANPTEVDADVASSEAPAPTPETTKKPNARKTRKQTLAEDFIGVKAGQKVTFDGDVGYADSNREFTVEGIGRDGSISVRSEKGATVLSWGEIRSAKTRGVKVTAVEVDASAKAKSRPSEAPTPIKDFGEKIGGARKDQYSNKPADKPANKKPKKNKNKEAYHKDFKPVLAEDIVAASSYGIKFINDVPGQYVVFDSRKGRPLMKRVSSFTYGEEKPYSAAFQVAETLEEAEQLAAVAAVTKKHRVAYYKNDNEEAKYRIERRVSDRKRWVIKDGFETENEAKKYLVLNAQEIYNTQSSFGEDALVTISDPERTGTEHRKNNRNVADQEFMDTFGFRGVEFGNWNNQEDRQELINSAYDGFMDLAEILNVPPKALALNGDLAIAFGARGHGLSGARAHYEPGRMVINLTKLKGSGALAHEWLHAFDHYLARLDGKFTADFKQEEDGSKNFGYQAVKNTRRVYASHGTSVTSKLREEVSEKLNAVIETMISHVEVDADVHKTKLANEQKWAKQALDRIDKQIAQMRDYLATEQKYGKRYTKPATEAQLKEFDSLAKGLLDNSDIELETRFLADLTGSKAKVFYSTNDRLDDIARLYKKVRGRWPFNAEKKGALDKVARNLSDYQRRQDLIELVKKQKPEDSKKLTSTNFLREAYHLDSGRVGDYWTTRHEMLARAFTSFVEDKVRGKGERSDFLSYGSSNAFHLFDGVKPFPEGSERKDINEKFQALVDVLKTKDTDDGVMLYSKKTNKSEGMTVQSVANVVGKLSRKLPGLYRVVQSVDDLPDKHKNNRKAKTAFDNARGFYDPSTNEVFLIADNIRSEEEAEMTYLHEVVGHFGIRMVFGSRLPSYLDKIAVQAGKKKLAPIAHRYGLNLNKQSDVRIAVEEYIAHTAELDGRKPMWFRRLVARMRDWLRTMGFIKDYTNNDIYSLIAMNRNETVDSMLAESRQLLESLAADIAANKFDTDLDADVRQARSEEQAPLNALFFELAAVAYSGPTIYGKSKAKKLDSILAKVDADLEVMEGRPKRIKGTSYNQLIVRREYSNDPELRVFGHDTDTPFVEIGGTRGTGGVALYIAAMTWANNNNKTLRPDPRGLSYVNNLRRTEAMLASAMREKTTTHLEPAETQFIGLLPDDLYKLADDPHASPLDNDKVAEALKELKAKYWSNERLAIDNESVFRTNVHNLTSASLALSMRRVPELAQYSINSKGELYGVEDDGRAQRKIADSAKQVLDKLKARASASDASHGVGTRTSVRVLIASAAYGFRNNQRSVSSRVRSISDAMGLYEEGGLAQMPQRALVPSSLLRRTQAAFNKDASTRINYALNEKPETVAEMLNVTEKTIVDRARRWVDNKAEGLSGERYGVLSLRQLSDVASRTMPHIKLYVQTVHRMMTRRNQLAESAVDMANDLQKWSQRSTRVADELFEIMHESTLAQVDPAEDFVERKEMLLKRIKTLQNQMRSRPGEKHLEKRDEIKAAYSEIASEPERSLKHIELSARLNSIGPEAKAHFVKVRDAYKDRHDTFLDVMKKRIEHSDMQDHEKRSILAELRWQHETSQLGGAYFPLGRFGQYWLETRDENGERVFTTYENKRDQQSAAKKLKSKGHEVTTGKMLDVDPDQDGASLAFVQGVMDKIKETGMFKDNREQIQDAVYQMYLQALPSRSMRKQFVHRKGVEGFHKDAIRVFADTMMKNSFQLARLEYQDELSDQMIEMQKFAKKGGNERAELYNEMRKRHEWVMNPTNSKWSQSATSIGFVWLLGLTPAAALVNTTQNMVVALPVLASKFGWKRAATMLAKTSGEFIGSGKQKAQGKYQRWSMEEGLSEAERLAYNELVDMGVIDTTMAHNLAGIAETDAYNYSDTTHKTMSVVSYLFHKAEIYNRETTAISAYRLARESGKNHGKAVDYAADVVWDSHFDYTNTNRARFMQSNLMKVALQFKQYSQNISYYLLRNAYVAMRDPLMSGVLKKGERFSKQQRREASVQLGGTLAITAALGGITTMPLLTIANVMANAMHGEDEDEPWDALTELKQWLRNTLGEEAADIVIWGVGGAGVSGRISLNGLWVREPYRDMDGQDLWAHYAQQAAGPVYGGIAVKGFRGAQKVGEGDIWKGIEMMVPKAFADISKAVRYKAEGATTKEGYSLKDEFSLHELAAQASGFTSHDLMKRYDANSAIRNYEQHVLKRRSQLIEQFYVALTMNDKPVMKELLSDMAVFSRKNPMLAIKPRSLKTSIKNRMRNKVTNVNGLRYTNTIGKYADQITYGE